MLTEKDLDGLKLVTDQSNIASTQDTQQALETAFQQGSQGWGVRREQSVILRLARDLKVALALAVQADENGRMLKGAQMELGRVKKQRDECQLMAVNSSHEIARLTAQLAELRG